MSVISAGLHRVFKSTTPFLTIISPTGEPIEFIGGMFHTDNAQHISFLEKEVKVIGAGKSKHPLIYIDADQQEVDPEALTPLSQMRAKLKQEILAEMAAATDKTNDMGNYDSSKAFATSINNSDKVENATPSANTPVVTAGGLAGLQALKAAKEAEALKQENAEKSEKSE